MKLLLWCMVLILGLLTFSTARALPAEAPVSPEPAVHEAENGEFESTCSQVIAVGGKEYLIHSCEVAGYPVSMSFERSDDSETEISAHWIAKKRQWRFQWIEYSKSEIAHETPKEEQLAAQPGPVNSWPRVRWKKIAEREIKLLHMIAPTVSSKQLARALRMLALDVEDLPEVPRSIRLPRDDRAR